MKCLTTILFVLFGLPCLAQQEFHKQIFTDSVIAFVLEPPGIPKDGDRFYLLRPTDHWNSRRFHKLPAEKNKYSEGIHLYVADDSLLKREISEATWRQLAQRATQQTTGAVGEVPSNVSVLDLADTAEVISFFSITKPLIFQKYAMLDLTYYYREEDEASVPSLYRGQALMCFKKQGNKEWKLIRIVNRFVL